MRSPYTLDNPPPSTPPPFVLIPSLWPTQARWWLKHTPDPKRPKRCRTCTQLWPCWSWACWDGQLGEALASRCAATKREAILDADAHL